MCPQTTPSLNTSDQKYGATKPMDAQKFKTDASKVSEESNDSSASDTDEDEYVAFGGTEDLKEKSKFKDDKEEGDAELGEKARDSYSKANDKPNADKMKAPRENI